MTHPPHDARGRPLVVDSGTRLGPYEVLLCIARGGMASVWAARQHGARGFTRLVALKTILPELATPDLDGMFLDEARVTARIHHPNVCEVFELIEYGGVLALSMEWVDGETLNNIISSRPKDPALDPRIAAQVIACVASGLHAAHELRDERGAPLQLVHRDVSPQNILISRTGHVKVTDFGVAKSLGAVREATAIGKVKGKLSYMSPEQAQGKVLDRRSDIFSLGVVLYLATVGQHPFRRTGESRNQQLARLLTNRVRPPSELVKGYPQGLEAIVMRALSRNPAQRFGTAEEMARRLQDWVLDTGPLVTDHQISQMVLQRVGPAIVERSERIANMLAVPVSETLVDDLLHAPPDPTLVPTTSRSGTLSPERRRARATLRVVSTTLTAGALGLAASFLFSRSADETRLALPAPVELASAPAATTAALASLPASAPGPEFAPDPAASAAASPSAPESAPPVGVAPPPSADDSPGQPDQGQVATSAQSAAKATSTGSTSTSASKTSSDKSTSASSASAKSGSARSGSTKSASAKSGSMRSSAGKSSSGKSKKTLPRRKPAARRDDSFAIKTGR